MLKSSFKNRAIKIKFYCFKISKTLGLLFALLWVTSISISAKGPILSTKKLQAPPPRIIRTCCSFGVKVSLFRLPIKITEITSIEKIDSHEYIKLNHKFPFKKIFPNRTNRSIHQKDFGILLQYAKEQLSRSKRGWLSQAEI